jgi:hypothetical protein
MAIATEKLRADTPSWRARHDGAGGYCWTLSGRRGKRPGVGEHSILALMPVTPLRLLSKGVGHDPRWLS